MKTKLSCLFLICTLFVGLFASVDVAQAASAANLTYKISDDCAIITGCNVVVYGAMEIPETINGYPVIAIDDNAFDNCASMTSVIIPDGVTNIGSYAFSRCSKLTKVTLPDSVTRIGFYAFYSCSSLTSITIPDSVTTIENYAFEDCTGLTSITIPSGVTFLGDWAFEGCTNLTSITIPDSVTGIYQSAFAGTAYYNDDANWENDALYIDKHLIKVRNTISGEYIVKDGTKSIGGGAFSSCDALTSISIPDSVAAIGGEAFAGCHGLTSITIPDGVTTLGGYTFFNCSSLTSITIPDSITSIGIYAFSNTAYYNNDENWENDVLYIGNHLIVAKSDISGEYNVKDGTKHIAGGAFYCCNSLTSITIPDSVTSIGHSAFYACTSLTNIIIPDSVIAIGYDVFSKTGYGYNAANWENDVLYIGNHLIDAKNDISGEYSIKDGTKCIGDYAFSMCSDLTGITIPDGVTSIGSSAFNCCYSLTSVTIPDSVTSIGIYAFYHCDQLTDVYYTGSRGDWADISIGFDDASLTNATIHYNYNTHALLNLYSTYDDSNKTVTITSDKTYSNVAILAASYQNGKLIGIQSKTTDIPIGNTAIVFDGFVATNADTVKVMVL